MTTVSRLVTGWKPNRFLRRTAQVLLNSTKSHPVELEMMNCSWKPAPRKMPTDWSRDGRYIVYMDILPKTKFDLWVLPLFGDRRPQPFAQREFNEKQGRLSPDGRWIAYASDETGRFEVYVQPFPASGGKWQITTGGGEQPQLAARRKGTLLRWRGPETDCRGSRREFFHLPSQRSPRAFSNALSRRHLSLGINTPSLPMDSAS